jgi:uncharacterized protein YqgV (UPF0045/DUF77 family)
MPHPHRASFTAEVSITTSNEAAMSPGQQLDSVRRAAADVGIAHESGPDATLLAGSLDEVLAGVRRMLEAAMRAGVESAAVRMRPGKESPRFDAPA